MACCNPRGRPAGTWSTTVENKIQVVDCKGHLIMAHIYSAKFQGPKQTKRMSLSYFSATKNPK